MDLDSLIDKLSHRGIKLAAKGNTLEIDAPKGAITTDLRNALASHKLELLRLLHQNNNTVSFRDLPTIVPDPELRYEPFPLTDMQYAFWVGRNGTLELGNVANHGYYEIEGQDLDLELLNWALQQLIERHDMLRATILPDGQQQIQQTVPLYQMKIVDLRGQEADVVGDKLEEIRDRLSHQVVATDRWPLFEFCATRLDGGRVRLHISYDLQIFDAWSLFRLFDEWFQLYQNPQVELKTLELSFRDYVLAEQELQNTELYKRSQRYWFERIDTLPPAPDLPLAKSPQELKQHICKRYAGGLELGEWQQLKQRASQIGLTPSGILLAAFAEVLTVWSKSPQFTISLALFNRLPLHPQVYDILGDFISVTLLKVDNSASESFTDRSLRLQRQLWQDLEHRYFSGVGVTREIARRKGTLPRAIPVVFTSTLGLDSIGQQTATFSHFGELVYGITQASQAWMDIQVWSEQGQLTFNWDVVEELFPAGLIADMFETYCHFLKHLATSETAWQETNRQLVPPSHLAQQCLVNATVAPTSEEMLHTLFAARVREQKKEPAIISPQRTLTYQELYELSNQVAHKLRSLGVTPNQLVAVVMEKGWEQIVAVLGILNSGAAYVPIDPSLPQERREYILQNSQVELVLTQSWLDERLAWSEQVVRLCLDDPELSHENKEPLESIQTPDDLAYLIYTSGSTGTPKGVAIEHRGAVNTIIDINQRFGVNSSDRVLALSSLSFDLSVYDIFGTLAAGGTIVIPEASGDRDPAHWAKLIVEHEITIWNSVPALMQIMVDWAKDEPQVLTSLRLVMLSGDWLPLTLPPQITNLNKNIQVISLGGATEASIWSIVYPIKAVESNWKSIPYGRPMANQRFYVFNELLETRPVWVPGQLYIGGIGVARCYWQEKAKTEASFIIHPHTNERLYRTGDLGRYLPDGNIEFLGREDFQVKIGGYRIELGEIEAVLTRHPLVEKAIIAAAGKQLSEKRLVAYVVANQEVSCEDLKLFLAERLPNYMIPLAFIFLESLPLSANGKVDRGALPSPDIVIQESEGNYVAPQNEVEESIAAVWQEVLNLEKIGANDNFFESGGNSLLITKIYSQLKNVLSNEVERISLVELFKYSTIRSLAKLVTQSRQALPEVGNSQMVEQLTAGKTRLKQRLRKSKAKIAN
ncbi:MAG: amino acid adenylation domain-containing protein [Cyanobacteria bacterium P01_E01_bin.35]